MRFVTLDFSSLTLYIALILDADLDLLLDLRQQDVVFGQGFGRGANAVAQTTHAVIGHTWTTQEISKAVLVIDRLTEQRRRLFRGHRLRIHPRCAEALCFT